MYGNGHGPDTERFKRALHDEMEPLAKRLGSLKAIASIGAALLILGFCAAVAVGKFALADDLSKHTRNENKKNARQDTDIAVLRAIYSNVEADLHWHRDAQTAQSRKQGVTLPAAPKHVPLPKPTPEEDETP